MQIYPHLAFANSLIIYAFRFLSFLFVSFGFDLIPYTAKVIRHSRAARLDKSLATQIIFKQIGRVRGQTNFC